MEDTNTSTTSVESQGSYVQSLLSPAGELGDNEQAEVSTQPQQAAASEGTTPEQAAATDSASASKTATTPELDALIQQFATETGLDSSDPTQRKTLKRLADKELFIRKLQADNESLKGTAGKTATDPEPELLTDFEKELQGNTGETAQAAKPAPQVETKPDATKDTAPVAYGDAGDTWKTPEDSLVALNEAWGKNDLKSVHEIEAARLRRNFDSMIAPQLLNYIAKMVDQRLNGFVEKDLGDVIPEVRRSVADKRIAESRDFAITQLRQAGASNIDKLFEVEDGPPIKFDGQEFPNTPLNQILTRHPEIMQITGRHADPAKAERQAFIARYKLAYQIFKQQTGGVPAATAKKLVEAGRESRERDTQDRARQAINAGSGTSGIGTDKSSKASYVGQLNNLPGELPLSSLLG